MRRRLVWGIGLVLLAALVLFPAFVGTGRGEIDPDPATVTEYRASFVVGEDGDLRATETLRVRLPEGRHGIVRSFDLRDPRDAGSRLQPRDLRVTRDGESEPFTTAPEGQGRFEQVTTGSPGGTLEGEHTYVLRYTIRGVLAPGRGGGAGDDQSVFYWRLVPVGWAMPIGRAEFSVQLPRAPQGVQCAVGSGALSGCRPEASGNALRLETGPLLPNTPVTVRTVLDMPAPDRDELPWPIRLDPVLGRTPLLTALVLALATVAAYAGWRGGEDRASAPHKALWLVAVLVTVVLATWNPLHLTALALVPGLWAVLSADRAVGHLLRPPSGQSGTR